VAAQACLFLLILLLTPKLSMKDRPSLAIWNVGQGQWVTVRDHLGCWHFDMGGEFAPWREIMALCRSERNHVILSHWDWDHVGFVGRARIYLPNICLMLGPQGRASPRKEKLLAGLEPCAAHPAFAVWSGALQKTANASSHVVLWRGILLPGDSSRDQEKYWAHQFPGVPSARLLVLGHHGSATSTGQELLKQMQNLKLAISSARFRRYGHPHIRVRQDLRKRGVPLLRTEDWGSIRMEL